MPKVLPQDFFENAKPIALVFGGNFFGIALAKKLYDLQVKVIFINLSERFFQKELYELENDNFQILKQEDYQENKQTIARANYIFILGELDDSLFEDIKKYQSKFVVSTPELKENLIKNNLDVREIEIRNLYGPGMQLQSQDPFQKMLKQAAYNETITTEEGIAEPLYIDDAVEGVVKALLTSGTKGKTITLKGKRITLKSLAELITRIREEGVTQGGEYISEEDGNIDEELLTSWYPKMGLIEGLTKTLNQLRKDLQKPSVRSIAKIESTAVREEVISQVEKKPEIKEEPTDQFWNTSNKDGNIIKKVEKSRKRISNSSLTRSALLGLTAIMIPIFWLFILPFVEIGVGAFELSLAKKALLVGDSEKVKSYSSQSNFWLDHAHTSFLRWQDIPFLKNTSKLFAQNSKVLLSAAKIANSTASSLEHSQILVNGIFGEDFFSLKKPAEDLAFELKNIEREIGFLEAELQTIKRNPIFSGLTKLAHLDLDSYRQAASGASEILPLFPELLGDEGKKTYLVLFQNNMEIRPSGGFIGSYGLLTFEKGRLTNFEVQDVYSADGQLKGHVEPPVQIKQHLGEAGWYLRDSNWSPDFPSSASRASWFLDKELSQKVNGVAAVDLEFVKNVLRELGQVELEDFNEIVTADNVYEKAQRYAEKDFFPGSTGKKDFLTALARKLLFTITEDPQNHQAALGKSIVSSLEGKHIMLWTDNAHANTALNRAGWDGSIDYVPCGESTDGAVCASDYLQVVDANLGVNKSNYFLDRLFNLEISLGDRVLTHKLTITYKNSSQAGVWPGGDYKNYLRVYTSNGSKLKSFFLQDLATGTGRQITTTTEKEKGKIVYGGLTPVEAGTTKQVIIEWDTPIESAKDMSRGELILLWQKQPGTIADPMTLTITTPESALETKAYPAPLLTTTRLVRYNTDLRSDFSSKVYWKAEHTE